MEKNLQKINGKKKIKCDIQNDPLVNDIHAFELVNKQRKIFSSELWSSS